MEFKNYYLDLIMIPLSFIISISYNLWLWHKVRTEPLSTVIGANAHGRRLWVSTIMKDNDKKNILAIQTIRNTIMGSTLMATTSIVLCCGLAAVVSSSYSVKTPLNNTIYGAHGQFMVALKFYNSDFNLCFRAFREEFYAWHDRKPAFLFGTSSYALDFWSGACFVVFFNHGACAL
ncbi:unnamed protein product [Lactuca virosa]|uniref:NADH-plastoquinone oxidoreductase subunit 5 n=1 Tax=Lactuca virosa TaxID=75947 RepID=A0AAU9MLN6_9ASTR|nr:unnamed protein product [Lactuca virosa]